TRDFLMQREISVPDDVYGDPALLLPRLFPKLKAMAIPGKIVVLPNFNEFEEVKLHVPKDMDLISPVGYWKDIVRQILQSELVLTSSLHGLIIAEVFGVPVRLVAPCGGETLFKYEDYLEGTGRRLEVVPPTFLDGISEEDGVQFASPVTNPNAMFDKFPIDLIRSR